MLRSLEFGPIICTDGPHKGRIGFFDDTDSDCDNCTEYCCSHNCTYDEDDCENCPHFEKKYENCSEFAIVYWGNMLFCSTYQMIPIEHCSNNIPIRNIYMRIEVLSNEICKLKESKKKAELLQELIFAQTLFNNKHIQASFSSKEGQRLFISHSSMDKEFANCLYADLIEYGYNPWLDNWDIKAGQSIPHEIQKGLANSDYILVLLSSSSVKSDWVTAEWETILWDEINSQKTKIIPLLLETCTIHSF